MNTVKLFSVLQLIVKNNPKLQMGFHSSTSQNTTKLNRELDQQAIKDKVDFTEDEW